MCKVRAARSQAIAMPEAAFAVADEVWQWANGGRIPIYRRTLRERVEEIRSQLIP